MMEFLEIERRDFLPKIDIAVKGLSLIRLALVSSSSFSTHYHFVPDFEGQGKMTLSANIAYKGNWQNGALTGNSSSPVSFFLPYSNHTFSPPSSTQK